MLNIKDISIWFGGLAAVNKVNITLPNRAIHGLIGPNGAGKTTLFNIISGIYTPSEGTITLDEKEIQGLQPYKINELGISRTYQNIKLFKSMSCIENVMVERHCRLKSGIFASILRLPSERAEEKKLLESSMELLEFFGLADLANDMADSLPYGKQRLLEIARAVAGEPKILLLDEPAAGMNSKEKEDLAEYINRIFARWELSILLVEHDMRFVMNTAEYIHVLNFGNKLAQGTPKEIQNNPDVIEAYLGGA